MHCVHSAELRRTSVTNYNTVDWECHIVERPKFLLLSEKKHKYRIFPLYDSEVGLEFFNHPSYL